MTQRILVIKLSALGDFIQALGPMKAIRTHHKDAHITLLTTKAFAQMGKDCGYFDDVLIDTRPKFYDLSSLLALRSKLIAANFWRVYDLQNNDRTGLYLWMMTPHWPEWVGTAFGASHRNNDEARATGKAFDGHAQTLNKVGISNIQIDTLDWMQADTARLQLNDRFILIVAGCAPTRPEKRWPAKSYIDLCTKLYELQFQPVLIGTNAEKDITDEIAFACPFVKNLTGQTSLYDIAALGHYAAGAIGNDTGPMHLLSVTGCKSVMIFSTGKGSNPEKHGPLGVRSKVISASSVNDISVDQVLTAFT